MKTHSVHKARSEFSRLVDRALAGEPQRITRYGKDAVVLVAESEWQTRARVQPNLGSLLARHARSGKLVSGDLARPFSQKRPLGRQFD